MKPGLAQYFRNIPKPNSPTTSTDNVRAGLENKRKSSIEARKSVDGKKKSIEGIFNTIAEQKGLIIKAYDELSDLKNNFTVIKLIGDGHLARVYCVRNKINNKVYALKVQRKADIIGLNQVDHVRNERDLLFEIDHPFIVKLFRTYVDSRHIYLLEDFIDGGELFGVLRKLGYFEIPRARLYAAEIVLALEYLHSKNIAYRDLKPENLLLDSEGHIKVCDFGFAKKIEDRSWTLCGTPEYMAPEVLLGLGHHHASDWWSLGILIYEMIAGYPPFYAPREFELYQQICDLNYKWTSSNFDDISKDLISSFLTSPSKRLGNLSGGANDVKQHKFFAGIDWVKLEKKQIVPPALPPRDHPVLCDNTEYENLLKDQDGETDLHEPTFRDFDAELT